jgi:uncharacterized protein DUF4430
LLPKLSERQQALAFAALLAVALTAVYVTVQGMQAPPVLAQGEIHASLRIETASWTISYVNVTTTNNTVFSLLREASDRQGFPVRWVTYTIPDGVFVLEINGTANGDGGLYWQYWVDGVYGDRAADKKEVFNGDQVIWRHADPREGM